MSPAFVYVISAGENRHKIGKGRDPEERRRMLQTGTSEPLEVLHSQYVANPLGVEGYVHKMLADHRLTGEWFAVGRAAAVEAVRSAVEQLGGESPIIAKEPRLPRKVVDGVGLEARRKAVRDYHARRTESGLKKVTVWLSEDSRADLADLAKIYGSKDRAVAVCLAHHTKEPLPNQRAKAEKPPSDAPAPSSWQDMPRAKVGKVTTVLLSNGPQKPKPGSLLKKR